MYSSRLHLVAPLLIAGLLAAPAQAADPSWVAEPGSADFSAARIWNEEILYGIRRDTARPPVHARNLFHLSICMWDAWAAYDATAAGYLVKTKMAIPGTPEDTLAAREEAISFACYRLLRHRFAASNGFAADQVEWDATMDYMGYDKTYTTADTMSPAGFGNLVAQTVIAWGLTDNSNESANYANNIGYQPVNPALLVTYTGNINCDDFVPQDGDGEGELPPFSCMNDPNRWQPLALAFFVDQGGIALGAYPPFICPHWGHVTSFGLRERDRTSNDVYFDPGPPPLFGTATHQDYVDNLVDVVAASQMLSPDDDTLIDISPAGLGNNTIGENDGNGYLLNPVTGLPYVPQLVKRGDWARVIAEFWADGPTSETPPGHWNTLASYASELIEEKRIGGEGPVVDDLEWDVKLYFTLNGAEHDAAIACWGAKGHYDAVRPISGIRYLCDVGQATFPDQPNYDPNGMPLIDGLIEIVTEETTAAGQRHEHLAGFEGQIAVNAWAWKLQDPLAFDPLTEYAGVDWILCGDWVPYQRPTFVSPPFGSYFSGHSTYSFTGASVLHQFTGSPYFAGGLGTFHAEQNQYLVFEDGPSTDIELQWASYYDSAWEAGYSRIVGGIHWQADNTTGQKVGQKVGMNAWHKSQKYWDGSIEYHSSDQDHDNKIDLAELLRVVQLFNSVSYGCNDSTEDGYDPMMQGEVVLGECYPHDGDYGPADFKMNLSELLRVIQFYSVGDYSFCKQQFPPTEDSFCCPV